MGKAAGHGSLWGRRHGPVVKAWERGGVSLVRGAPHAAHGTAPAASAGSGGAGDARHSAGGSGHHRHGWSLFPLFRFSRHHDETGPESVASDKYTIGEDEERHHGSGSWNGTGAGGGAAGGAAAAAPSAPRDVPAPRASAGRSGPERVAGSKHWWEV